MTDRPEALRLADALEFGAPFVVDRDLVAVELRKLHAAHEHQYAMAGLMLREAERTQRELDKLREAARNVLQAWDMYGTAECLRGWIDILRKEMGDADA